MRAVPGLHRPEGEDAIERLADLLLVPGFQDPKRRERVAEIGGETLANVMGDQASRFGVRDPAPFAGGEVEFVGEDREGVAQVEGAALGSSFDRQDRVGMADLLARQAVVLAAEDDPDFAPRRLLQDAGRRLAGAEGRGPIAALGGAREDEGQPAQRFVEGRDLERAFEQSLGGDRIVERFGMEFRDAPEDPQASEAEIRHRARDCADVPRAFGLHQDDVDVVEESRADSHCGIRSGRRWSAFGLGHGEFYEDVTSGEDSDGADRIWWTRIRNPETQVMTPGLRSCFVRRLFGAALVVVAAAATGFAQDLWRLPDGSFAEGVIKKTSGGLVVTSPFGTRVVATGECTKEDAKAAQVRFAALAAETPEDFAAGRAALARWAYEAGLHAETERELERVFTADIDQPVARDLIRRIALEWTVHPGETATAGKERTHAIDAIFEEFAPKGKVEAVLAAEKAARFGAEQLVLRRALKSLKHQLPHVRWLGARVLSDFRSEPERINPLYKRALLDDAYAVRREAVRSLKVSADPVFVRLFAKNLYHKTDAVRVHAGEALGELGMAEALEPLVAALADTWKPVRNHIAVTTQRAYVKDFDVEVAQAAVIADPIVDVVTEGAILDVAVVAITVERHTYSAALSRLSGLDYGTNAEAWYRWLAARSKS